MYSDIQYRLRLFGSPALEADAAHAVDVFPTRRAAAILARLGIAPDRWEHRRDLAGVLWPDEPYDVTSVRLRQELARLRKALGEHASMVVADGDRLRLDARVDVDVEQFQTALREAREAPAESAEMAYARALQLSRHPFLEGWLDEWAISQRRRLLSGRFTAMLGLAEVLLASGSAETALEWATKATELFPRREDAHVLCMRCQRALGHVVDALNQFETLRQLTADAGGVVAPLHAARLAEELRTSPISESEALARSPFVSFGREKELAKLCAWLDPETGPARLATVLGPGGIGKTHVVQLVLRQLYASYAGQLAFVDLTEISNPGLIPATILALLTRDISPALDPQARLRAVIPDRPYLLVLDNLEQFGEAVAPVVNQLLLEHPQLRILASSRVATRVQGEYRLLLRPLDHEESASPAESLFRAAAEAAGAFVGTEPEVAAEVAHVVRKLEGLPLAILLAAPRLRTMSLAELRRALELHPGELSTADTGVPHRHRELARVVRDSLDLVAPAQRQALARLAIFRGGWTAEAAEQVAEMPMALSMMNALLDASLIERMPETATTRFRMLESVREHVRQELAPNEHAKIRKAHLDWMLGLSQQVAVESVTEAVVQRYAALEREQDNFREAMRSAVESNLDVALSLAGNLATFWLYRSTGFEPLSQYRDLFERFGDGPATPNALHASYGHCICSHFLSDVPNRLAVFDRTLRFGRELGIRRHEPMLLSLQAFHAQNSLDYRRCDELMTQAQSVAREIGDDSHTGMYLRLLGTVHLYRAEFREAQRRFAEAIRWFQERGEIFPYLYTRLNLARASVEAGDNDLAEAMFDNLIEELHRVRHDRIIPSAYYILGQLQVQTGRRLDARESFRTARDIFTRRGSEYQVAEVEIAEAALDFQEGCTHDALRRSVNAAVRWLKLDRPVVCAIGLVTVAHALWNAGDVIRAHRIGSAAKRTIDHSGARIIPNQRDSYRRLLELLDSVNPGLATPELSLEDAVALASVCAKRATAMVSSAV